MADNQRSKNNLGALILAAGLSSRMGRPKMLLPWQDSTIIQTVVNAYVSAGISEIIVVTGGVQKEIENLLARTPVRLVFNPHYANGEMLDSLKLGLSSFSSGIQAVLIALGDQPGIGRAEVELVVDGFLGSKALLVVPSYQMRRGHPWVVDRLLWEQIQKLEKPDTLRDFLNKNSKAIHYINIHNPAILMDMDTPEDYERLRNGNKRTGEKIQCWKFSPLAGLEKMKFLNGEEPASLDKASSLIPPGAYTTFRTYNKSRVLYFTSHLNRLETSARMTNHIITMDKGSIRLALKKALAEAPWEECRVRVTLELESGSDCFYLFLEELKLPTRDQYLNGVNVRTIQAQRENPLAKLTNFLPIAASFRSLTEEMAYETIMAGSQGELLEGLSSNFFGIEDGQLRTAGTGVLEGITRTFVLEIADNLNIPVSLNSVNLNEIDQLEEAFITSSSRGILPVVRINDHIIGSGKPGLITGKLRAEFLHRLEKKLEDI